LCSQIGHAPCFFKLFLTENLQKSKITLDVVVEENILFSVINWFSMLIFYFCLRFIFLFG